MRRREITYAAIALLTLGFTACSQEEDFAPQGGDGQEIRLATRSTTYDSNDDGFTEGQIMTIGILPKGVAESQASFYKYTYQNGGWVGDKPMKVNNFEGLEKVYAYIGFSNVENDLERYKSLSYKAYLTDIDNSISDQSGVLLNFDWMIPDGEVDLPTAENPVINAHFIHGLAKVTVGNIEYGTEYEETPVITDVRFKSYDSSCYNDTYDTVEDEFVGLSSNNSMTDVKPFEDTKNGTYTALLVTNRERNIENKIVVPTEWTLLTLKVNGEEKTVKLVDNPETTLVNEAFLAAGTHYTFYLKVGKDKVTIGQVTTDTIGNPFDGGWDNDSETDLN